VRHYGFELWVFNGEERAMTGENARADGLGCAEVVSNGFRTIALSTPSGPQQAKQSWTKTHLSGACGRASLIIRAGA
jgi:hypothetical protein